MEEQLRDFGGTSPAAHPQADPETEISLDYATAAKILTERTGDLGAALLAFVPPDIVGMRERVIAAARLHPDHRPQPGPTDPCPGAPDAVHA